ncbi:MAG: YqgE/AlgH family protein [Solirubrobacterales bacterium]
MDSLRGKLLVASPTIDDPNFRRSVVLITEHGEDGAMGLVLNRRSEITVSDGVPELGHIPDLDDQLHLGGPVQPTGVIVVAEFLAADGVAVPVFGSVGLLAADAEAEEISESVSRARAFAGHAGWGADQLRAEMDEESWFVAAARTSDLFADDPQELWPRVLERMGGEYTLLSRLPDDPTLN